LLLLVIACCVAQAAPEPAELPGDSKSAATASPQPTPTFDIAEYRVLGNTALDARDVESALYPLLGANKSLTDVESARAALEKVYHDHGFGTVFVDIPEQSVEEGVVRLRVTEGRLHAASVSGARYFLEREIRAAVPEATVGHTPSLPLLQSELNALNAMSPDRRVVPVLRAGPVPGTIDLALKVDDHLPLHGSLELNNQYTADTRPLRLVASLSYDNLFNRFDSISLQYQVAPQKTSQVKVFAAGYTTHVGPDRGALSFSFIDNSSAVATVGAIAVIGKGRIYGTRYEQSLSATPELQSRWNMGIDYKDFAQNVRVDAKSGVISTPIRYVNFSVGYFAMATSAPRRWTVSTTANFGIRGVVNEIDAFANKCYGCRPNYFSLRAGGSVNQQLPRNFEISLRVAAQAAFDPLINNEQFLVGGADSVRGYLAAEALGDVGASGSLELHAPDIFATPKGARRVRLVPLAFFDAGRVRNLQPLPGEAPPVTLRSLGVGLDFSAFDTASGSLYWADPLVTTTNTAAHKPRWQFSVRGSW
jgi:hemolysin activation/secretion protein